MNALATIDTLTPAVFSEPGGIDALLQKLEADVRAIQTDISTAAGRAAVKSLAHQVARSKTAFDSMGKELVSEWKEKAKLIDKERARVWDRLESLQAEVRAPLTEWEEAEALRIAGHHACIAEIQDIARFDDALPPTAEIVAAISVFEALPERDWQEFKHKAASVRAETFAALQALKHKASERDAADAELARLRAEEAERLRREHEQRIADAAAAEATRRAEENARREAQRVADEAAARERKAAKEKADAVARAEKAERAAADAAAKAEHDRVAAEAREKEMAARAERDRVAAIEKADADRLAAVEAERRRVAEATRAEQVAAERRERDKAHRKQFNTEALAAFVAAGLTEAQGVIAITAIVKGDIPHVKLTY